MYGMSGAAIIVLALATAVGLFFMAAVGPFSKMARIVTRSFWCPIQQQAVTVEFQQDAWNGWPLGVVQCDAFSPPTAITCEKRCLSLGKFRPAKTRATA